MSIVAEQITKIFGVQKALDQVSFTVNPGDILGFLGPNGAGKSTTMKILTCYIPQTSGNASVCGFDVSTQSLEVRRQIGYLPELNPLYTDMYVTEYLLFSGEAQRMGRGLSKRVGEMIEQVGLGPERKKKIGQLSKGFRQRVGLAQAMLHNPQVLILDEPTSGLDPNQVGEIRELIREIGRDKMVILSTHIMQEVEAMCNRVIIINKGKIVADDQTSVLQQKLSSELTISVEFKAEVKESDLEKISGVTGITMRGKKIIIRSDKDIREEISRIAAENNWILLSMNLEENSLEEVFHKLTMKP